MRADEVFQSTAIYHAGERWWITDVRLVNGKIRLTFARQKGFKDGIVRDFRYDEEVAVDGGSGI